MLTELRITGLGVIEESIIEFGPGMTAVTGETGAGKTMVVSSLGLLLGQRADSGVVRRGAARAIVEGRFSAVEHLRQSVEQTGGELEDDELLIARQVSAGGRSRAFVGGVQASVGSLSQVAAELATIHGQSEQVRLGTPERQREVLDRFCGPEHLARLEDYQRLFIRRRELRTEREELLTRAHERAREKDMLAFGLDEIAALDPQPGEDEQLAAEASRLQATDDLRQHADVAVTALSGSVDGFEDAPGAIGLLGQARKAMAQAADLDPGAQQIADQLREVGYLLDDATAQVASYLADLEADPARLEVITGRRAELAGLMRKYGDSVDEVLAWARNAAERHAALSGADDRIGEIDAELVRMDDEVAQRAAALGHGREQAARELADRVREELTALAMPHARLEFELPALPEPGPHGAEQVQLVFSANPGSDLAPLSKVASGGELSRVRLALEAVLADGAQDASEHPLLHSFVFDEVDAGVGGAVAVEIGRRLARLAQGSQVIVVTHLAQVAAFADRQYVVSKSSTGQVTTSNLRRVTGDERLAELARMMGGIESSQSSLAHARELLETAGRAD